MTICEALAKQLNIIRKERGMTVTEFSSHLEISRSSLQAILSCKANPRSDTIDHIADTLQVDPIALLAASTELNHRSGQTTALAEQVMELMRAMLGEEHERDDL